MGFGTPPLTAEEVWTYVTRVLTSLDTPPLTIMEHEIGFPSAEALDDLSASGDTTPLSITVTIPSGASIVRASLIALITAMNDAGTLQEMNIAVKGQVSGADGWQTYFSQDACLGLPAVEGSTASLVAVQDVGPTNPTPAKRIVTDEGTFEFKLTVGALTDTVSVHFTTQFVLIVTYRMS